MKLTSVDAKDILEKEKVNSQDGRWIEHCLNVGNCGGKIAKALVDNGINVDVIRLLP